MKKKEEKRIYVVIPGVVDTRTGYVRQPKGRQIAQACHVVSKLRLEIADPEEDTDFKPITTIILQARNSRAMCNAFLALRQIRLSTVFFSDENEEAYGDFKPITAMAVLARPSQVKEALSAFPLWGSR